VVRGQPVEPHYSVQPERCVRKFVEVNTLLFQREPLLLIQISEVTQLIVRKVHKFEFERHKICAVQTNIRTSEECEIIMFMSA